jgi:hypothetical protein
MLSGRRQDDESANQLAGSGQGLWLEMCSVCGQPLTILAAEAPKDPRCEACAQSSDTGR